MGKAKRAHHLQTIQPVQSIWRTRRKCARFAHPIGARLGAIRPASPAARMGACRINLISQAVPTASRRVGLSHCRANIRPSPIWGGQTKWEIAGSMTELRYLAPDTLDEAIGAFAKAGSAARILAGGTDLLVQMRSGVLKPGVIVDIKKIPEMTAIEQTADGGFRIGAAVSGMALARPQEFRQGLARRAGSRQPDRFQAGAGPRVRRAAISATARPPATACPRWSRPAPSSPCRARTAAAK